MGSIGGRRAKRRSGGADGAATRSAGRTTSATLTVVGPAVETDEPAEAAVDYTQIGEHVGTVLEAAKAAAEKIMQQANKDAKRIRAEAEELAEEKVDEARKQSELADVEATRLMSDAKRQSEELREEANAYASGAREAAGAEAAVIIGNAERQAADGVEAAQARKRALDRKIEATEERVRQLVGGVRELASSLEELVPPIPVVREVAGNGDDEKASAANGGSHRPPLRLPARAENDGELFADESTMPRSSSEDQSGGW